MIFRLLYEKDKKKCSQTTTIVCEKSLFKNKYGGVFLAEKKERLFLIKERLLTEAMKKTLEAKELLEKQQVSSVLDAVERVGLSRSAFYKYRDAIFPFQTIVKEKLVSLFIELEHRSGTLSTLLSIVASYHGNIIAINQSIPLQGKASITVSLDVSEMEKFTEFIERIKTLDAVNSVKVIGSGM